MSSMTQQLLVTIQNYFISLATEICSFLIWANSGLLSFIFIPFSFPYQLLFQQYKLKKHRWCAWGLNLGPQNGSRRRNH